MKANFKRIISGLLAVTMIFTMLVSLTGCSKKDEPETISYSLSGPAVIELGLYGGVEFSKTEGDTKYVLTKDEGVVFTALDEDILKVDESGKLTPVAIGEGRIKALFNETDYEITISVVEKIEEEEVDIEELIGDGKIEVIAGDAKVVFEIPEKEPVEQSAENETEAE